MIWMVNKSEDSVEKLLTISKSAQYLNISVNMMKELLLDPKLPRIIFSGNRLRLSKRALNKYIDKRGQEWYRE